VQMGCAEADFVPPPPPEVTVAHPARERVTVYAEAPGRVAAVDAVDVVARVEGFIEEVAFSDGQMVDAGDRLFLIEPARYEAGLARARAAVERAEAELALADVRLQKINKAAAADAATPIEVVEAQAKRAEAAAVVSAAKADAAAAELELSYTEVLSPIAGLVSEAEVAVGDYVSLSGKVSLARVTAMDPVYVHWNTSERAVLAFQKSNRDLPRTGGDRDIPEDRRIEVQLRLADGEVYGHRGYIDYVAPEIDATTGTLQVRARVPNPRPQLFPGQFARVMVSSFEGEVTLVPEVAVQRDVVGPYLLTVNDDNTVSRRDVTLGELLELRRIVEKGVTPDDRIITAGTQRARPGLTVNPQPATPSASASSSPSAP